MTAKEYRFLMHNRKEMTIDDFYDLLIDNEITNYDPTIDAFKAFDPDNLGYIPGDKIREIFSICQFGEISHEEVDILIRVSYLIHTVYDSIIINHS
jgi:Ca2+-binding EF-hand superfamily protein